MNYRDRNLPKHWRQWVSNHPELSQGLCTPLFNNKVYLMWEDGSSIFFNHAFMVENIGMDEIAVFTEHCGYHVFHRSGLKDYNMLSYAKHETV